VESVALVHGYQVVLCNSERDTGREQSYVTELWEDGVQNVILGSSLPSMSHLADFIGQGLNLIAFDHRVQPGDPPSVVSLSVDNYLGAGLVTRHLLGLGHRRIGFISGPLSTVSRVERLGGYRAALAVAGVECEPTLIWAGGSHKGSGDARGAELGRLGARRLLSSGRRPTALVAINDIYALGACAGARELGLSVPDDVSIVGFDDIVLARLVNPPLTTVRQPLREMAQVAIRYFVDESQGGKAASSNSLVLPPRLIVRASTAPPDDHGRTEGTC
jgi:DNA-binding LacI/PurR family transcriptional regulator